MPYHCWYKSLGLGGIALNDNDQKKQPGTSGEQEGAAQTEGQDNLNEELEQLRDLFQKELDEQTQAAQENESDPQDGEEEKESDGISDWDRLVTVGDTPVIIEEDSLLETENAAAEEDEEDSFDENLCYCCQKNERNLERGEDYLYCEECREKMKHRPVRWYMIPVILLVIAAIVLSGYSMSGVVSDYREQVTAHKLILQDRPIEGLNKYFELYNQGVSSKPMLKQMARTLWEFGYIQNVQSILSSFSEDEIESDFTLSRINDKITAFNNTADAAYNIIADYESKPAAEIPYDDLMAQLNALLDGSAAATNTTDTTDATDTTEAEEPVEYDPMIVYYYQFYLAKISGKDAATQLEYLNKMKDSGSDDYKWLYYPELSKCLGETEDYERAFALCDELLKDNQDDATAYATRAALYRRQQNYDAALAEIAAGLESSADNPELLRQRAIIYLLQGDTANAKTDAEAAFNSSATVSTTNVLAVVYQAIGDTAGLEETISFLETYGTQLSDRAQSYIDGEITLEQLFLEGSADVA